MRKSLLALAAILTLSVVAASGCQPTPKATPTPGRVALGGDSITWTAGLWQDYYRGPGFDTEQKLYMGWQAENIQPRMAKDVTATGTSPEVFVLALGHNDAANGLDATDRNQLMSLALTPHPTACTVLVKPGYHGGDPVRIDGIGQYRAWVDQMVAAFSGRVVSVDATHIYSLPGIASDGIHLVEGSDAALAFYQLIVHAPEACNAR